MLRVILLEFLSVEAKLLVPLYFWYTFAVVRRINCVPIVRAISDMVTFYLTAITDVICWQTITTNTWPKAIENTTHLHERPHHLHNWVAF